MSDKASKKMRELVFAVAGPLPDKSRKNLFSTAARNAGVSYRSARSVFYGEIADPEHKVVRRLKIAAGQHAAENLADQFADLASALNIRDADFHSEDIAALVSAARALRGLDRTRADDEETG